MADVEKVFFDPTDEQLQNPYIGMVSFNHFRGERLFSSTGTKYGWKKERYPIDPSVEQEGYREGWHPDTELAYFRFLWKDFEPADGQFNPAFIQGIIDQAIAHRQHLILRMVPHNTPPYEDVPDWLRAMIPCPERPLEERVKDSPAHPLFLERFARAVRAFGQFFDGHPVLHGVDIALTGAWGEGHGWTDYPLAQLHTLMDAYTESFPTTHLFGQICAPELNVYARKKRPIGWRVDGFGSPSLTWDYYPTHYEAMIDFWKDTPIACEAFWYMGEWKNQGWDIELLADQVVRWHISSFNNKSSAIPLEWYPAVQRMLQNMGYRFSLRRFFFPGSAAAGETLQGNMRMENRGNAPIYHRIPLRLRLKNEDHEIILPTDIDITQWLPGETIENFAVTLPRDLPAGSYEVQLCIGEKYPETPLVRLACNAPMDGEWYRMTPITIQ